MSPDEAIKHLEVHFDSQSIGPANTICIDREAIGLALERMRRLRELEADRAQRAALWECPTCAEERGYQRGLAERDAELAKAKARIVALGVEGDEMDQKHLDELRERDDRLRELREEALTAAMLLRDEGWTIAAERLELAASAPAGDPSGLYHEPIHKEIGVTRPAKVRRESKTSEGESGSYVTTASPTSSTSPPAEAPQESGVPSGNNYHAPGCNTERRGCMPGCDNYDPEYDSPTGKDERVSPGTLRGEYERMAREWYREYHAHWDDTDDVHGLAALLARVADERQSEIVEEVRASADCAKPSEIANYIASNAWRLKS